MCAYMYVNKYLWGCNSSHKLPSNALFTLFQCNGFKLRLTTAVVPARSGDVTGVGGGVRIGVGSSSNGGGASSFGGGGESERGASAWACDWLEEGASTGFNQQS